MCTSVIVYPIKPLRTIKLKAHLLFDTGYLARTHSDASNRWIHALTLMYEPWCGLPE
jgi:hypothetical protein